MGPDYRESEALRKLGQIIGQHNPHIIPKGLHGAGNLLVFDNGGASGYGFANPAAPDGRNSVRPRQLARGRSQPGDVRKGLGVCGRLVRRATGSSATT